MSDCSSFHAGGGTHGGAGTHGDPKHTGERGRTHAPPPRLTTLENSSIRDSNEGSSMAFYGATAGPQVHIHLGTDVAGVQATAGILASILRGDHAETRTETVRLLQPTPKKRPILMPGNLNGSQDDFVDIEQAHEYEEEDDNAESWNDPKGSSSWEQPTKESRNRRENKRVRRSPSREAIEELPSGEEQLTRPPGMPPFMLPPGTTFAGSQYVPGKTFELLKGPPRSPTRTVEPSTPLDDEGEDEAFGPSVS
jgi:hypothetical protein